MQSHVPSTLLLAPNIIEIHYKRPLVHTMSYIIQPDCANTLLRTYINLNQIDLKEFFWVILLNNTSRVLGLAEIAVGTDSGVLIHTKEVFQLVLLSSATRFIVAHNHPSGSLNISKSDIQLTKKLSRGGRLFGVELLDHIILTSEDFVSLSLENKL